MIRTLRKLSQQGPLALVFEAHHFCTKMRGVRANAPLTWTPFWRGKYDSDASLRAEFFSICGVHP